MKGDVFEIQVGTNTVFMGIVPVSMAESIMSKYTKYPSDEVTLVKITGDGKRKVIRREGKRVGFPLGERAIHRPWR